MAYTPSVFDFTRPVDTDIAETAQLEFRTIKAFFQGTITRTNGSFTVANTVATTNILTATIAANSMGTNRRLRFTCSGYITNGSGGAQFIGFGANFGASSYMNTGLFSIANGSNCAFDITSRVANNNAANLQVGMYRISIAGNDSHAGVPQGITVGDCLAVAGGFAIDTTLATTWQHYFTLGVANVSYGVIVEEATVEWY